MVTFNSLQVVDIALSNSIANSLRRTVWPQYICYGYKTTGRRHNGT